MSVGSKLEAWFYIGDFKTASSIVVTEAPIDALSFYALHHEPGQLVLAAGFNHVPEKVLSLAKSHGLDIFCALDNDKGGEEGHQHLLKTYKENPFQSSEPKRLLPKLKDWSEDIMLIK